MIFFSYFPSYADLDFLLETYHPKQLNIFVDLKNCLTGMYYEENVATMVYNAKGSKQPNADIFLSWVDFVKFHYRYMEQRKVPIKMFTIADVGDSCYHKNIYKEYKCNRSITGFKTMSMLEMDAAKKLIKQNIETICKASEKLYGMYSAYLTFCESDFVGYWMIQKHFTEDGNLNVIYSTDKDMFQTLVLPNTCIFYRRNKENKTIYTKDNWFEKFKIENMDVHNCIYMRSIVGDTSDDIPGIKGIGEKKAQALLKDHTVASLNHLKDIVQAYGNKNVRDKILDGWDIVVRNYKLMSFEELGNHLSIEVLSKLSKVMEVEKLSYADSHKTLDLLVERLGG